MKRALSKHPLFELPRLGRFVNFVNSSYARMFDGCEDWSGGSGRAQEGRGRAGRSAEMAMIFFFR